MPITSHLCASACWRTRDFQLPLYLSPASTGITALPDTRVGVSASADCTYVNFEVG